MKYIITEDQFEKLNREPDVLDISFKLFSEDWDMLQTFLNIKGNPPYRINGNLDLYEANIESLGNLTSVGGYLDLMNTKITSLGSLTSVGGWLNLRGTPLSKKYTEEEIRQMVAVKKSILI
jgi:hypothetical protein